MSNRYRSILSLGSSTPPFSNVNSFSFDGIDEIFQGSSIYSELNGGTKLTVSVWVKPISGAPILEYLISNPRNATANEHQFALTLYENNNVQLDVQGHNSQYVLGDINAVTYGQWNHILACVDLDRTVGTEGAMFINGVDKTTVSQMGTLSSFYTATDALHIGVDANGGYNRYNGNMDELAIWSGQDYRGASEVSAIYNGGVPSDLNNTSGIAQPSLWFRMGEQATFGTQWTMTDVNASYSVTSANMVEANRTTDVPPNPFANLQSILLDGVDDYVEIGSPASIQNLTSAITISAWIKAPRTFSTNYYTLASKGEYAGSGSQWSIRINTANVRNTAGGLFSVFPNSNGITDNQGLTFPTPVDDNQWHHMMFVNDGTDLKVYIDGVLDATGVGKGRTLYNGNRTLRLGRLTASNTQKLIGNLDEVAIFGTALGLSDAQSIYNGGVPSSLSSYSSLVSWWRFEGSGTTATDSGSGGNDGTLLNGVTRSTDVPTFSKKSIALDGVDDFVQVADADNLSFGNGSTDSPFSISAWIKIGQTTTQGIVSKYGTNNVTREYLFQITASKIKLTLIASGGATNFATGNTALSLNTWHHVAVTYDGSGGSTAYNGITLYVNGVAETPTTGGSAYTAMTNTVTDVEIGRYSSRELNGAMDEVAIFSSELSQSDITAIYGSGVPASLASYSPLSWWRCGDGDTAPTLLDNGSGGNDGTMTNFSTFSSDVPT